LLFVHNTLVGAGLRGRIKIGAAGKIISAFDMATVLAIGADWVNAARGYMFAIGCIQSMSCHTNACPTGVATQDPARARALVVPDKAERVRQFHDRTVSALADMLAAAGLTHPDALMPHHIVHRVSQTEIRQFDEVHSFIKANSLIDQTCPQPHYAKNWARAQTASFDAVR
jgi:glutamate synthase domain-containing protein 2